MPNIVCFYKLFSLGCQIEKQGCGMVSRDVRKGLPAVHRVRLEFMDRWCITPMGFP